jgi:hypothetical protein
MKKSPFILGDILESTDGGEGILGSAVRNAYRVGTDIASGIGGLPRAVQDIAGYVSGGMIPKASAAKLPSSSDIKGSLGRSIEPLVGKDYLKPQGKIEEGVDRLGSYGPGAILTALSGGSLAPYLMSAAAGTTGGEIAKGLGFGDAGQLIGELSGGLAAGAGRAVAGGRKALNVAEDLRKSSYANAERLSEGLAYPTGNLAERVRNISKNSSRGLSPSSKKSLDAQVNNILSELSGGARPPKPIDAGKLESDIKRVVEHYKSGKVENKTIDKLSESINKRLTQQAAQEEAAKKIDTTVRNIWDAKKSINDFFDRGDSSVEGGSVARALGNIQKEIMGELNGPIAEKFPEFHQNLSLADTIHKTQRMESFMDGIKKTKHMERVVEGLTSPTTILLSSILHGPGKMLGVASLYGAGKGVQGARIANQLMKIPEISKAVGSLGDAIMKESPKLVFSKIKDVDKLVRKHDTSSPYILD